MPIASRVTKEPVRYLDYDPDLARRLGRAFALARATLVLLGLVIPTAVAVIAWRVLT